MLIIVSMSISVIIIRRAYPGRRDAGHHGRGVRRPLMLCIVHGYMHFPCTHKCICTHTQVHLYACYYIYFIYMKMQAPVVTEASSSSGTPPGACGPCGIRAPWRSPTASRHLVKTDRDTETQRHRDTATQRHRGTEAQRHRGTEAQRHRGTETQICPQMCKLQDDGTTVFSLTGARPVEREDEQRLPPPDQALRLLHPPVEVSSDRRKGTQ